MLSDVLGVKRTWNGGASMSAHDTVDGAPLRIKAEFRT